MWSYLTCKSREAELKGIMDKIREEKRKALVNLLYSYTKELFDMSGDDFHDAHHELIEEFVYREVK